MSSNPSNNGLSVICVDFVCLSSGIHTPKLAKKSPESSGSAAAGAAGGLSVVPISTSSRFPRVIYSSHVHVCVSIAKFHTTNGTLQTPKRMHFPTGIVVWRAIIFTEIQRIISPACLGFLLRRTLARPQVNVLEVCQKVVLAVIYCHVFIVACSDIDGAIVEVKFKIR